MKYLLGSKLPHIFLKPGELFLSRDPAIISTVLGSCVSITFFAPSVRLGAICHVMLPSGSIEDGFRYVDTTLDYMVEKLRKLGIDAGSCEVKLFGGSDMLLADGLGGNRLTIGRQNIQEAQRKLDMLGIVTKVSDVGGGRGRKLFFNSHTGDVFLKKVRKSIV